MSHDPALGEHSGIPHHPMLEGLLGRPKNRVGEYDEACQKHPEGFPGHAPPWIGDERAEEKSRIFSYVHNSSGGTFLSKIVRDVFDGNGSYDSADYQLTRRFVQNSELFTVRRSRGLLWVSQSLEGLSLTLSMQSAKTPEGSGAGARGASRRPRDVARARINRLSWIEPGSSGDDIRGELLGDLSAKKSGNEGRFLTFSRRSRFDDRDDHLLVPLETRFGSEKRAREQYSEYMDAWDRAEREHERGVMLTVTTDPKRFDSILEACSSIMADANRLRSWLAYDPASGPERPGERLPSIVVPEFTDSGLPHVHIVFFGASWLTTADALRGYVSENLDRCEQIHLDRISRRGGSFRWASDPDRPEIKGRSPREYLSEPLEARSEAALATSDELRAASAALAEHGLEEPLEEFDDRPTVRDDLRLGRRAWKAGLYFATDLRFFTRSPCLRADPSGLPHAPKWSLEVIATWEQLPRDLVGNADVISSAVPPPAVRPPGSGPPDAVDDDPPADLVDGVLEPSESGPWSWGETEGFADDD